MDQTKKEALTSSLAVFPGYLVVGIAFGLLAQQHQIGWGWALMMSVLVYAGSMQFVGIQLLAQAASPLQVILMTLAVNLRHLFYGFSFLREFGERGVRRLYLIFGLTDETYGLLCQKKLENKAEPQRLYFWITLLDQLWWVLGTLIGAAAGAVIPFDTTGIDFAMTALFFVTCLDQLKSAVTPIPTLVGLISAVAALVLFGADGMILPALVMIAAGLLGLRPEGERLYLAPRLPESWPGYSLRITLRATPLHITAQRGLAGLTVDGAAATSVPLDGRPHEVRVPAGGQEMSVQ